MPSPDASTSNANVASPTCTLRDFANGAWDFSADEPPPSCYVTVGHIVEIRQDCTQTAVDQSRPYERAAWRPQRADCPIFPRSGRPSCPGLAGKTVFVLGDSMARNFFEALQCRLDELDIGAASHLQCCQLDAKDKRHRANTLSPDTIFAVPAIVAPAPLDFLVVSTGPWWKPAIISADDMSMDNWTVACGGSDDCHWKTTLEDLHMNESTWRVMVFEAVEKRLRALDVLAESGVRVFVRAQDIRHPGRNSAVEWPACSALGQSEEEYLEAARTIFLETGAAQEVRTRGRLAE